MCEGMSALQSGVSADGLKAFLEEWREMRVQPEEGPLEVRLLALLNQLQPLLAMRSGDPDGISPVEASPLNAATFAPFLAQLNSALASARRQGALVNVWAMSGLRRDEVRNAGVLASLFDPKVSEGRGRAFLSAFLARIREGDRRLLPSEEELAQGYAVQTEARPLGAVDDRVDLSIEGADFVLLIEVKIDAREGTEQLARYEAVLKLKAQALGKRPALVYLSPTPARSPPPNAFYANWSDVRHAAQSVALERSRKERSFQDLLLAQFAEHVRNF